MILQAGDAYVEFGNVLVGSSGTKTFNICNNGDCLLKYRLSVDQKVEGNSADQQISSGQYEEIETIEGGIHSHPPW